MGGNKPSRTAVHPELFIRQFTLQIVFHSVCSLEATFPGPENRLWIVRVMTSPTRQPAATDNTRSSALSHKWASVLGARVIMVAAASAVRLAFIIRNRKQVVIVRQYAKKMVTNCGNPPSIHNKVEAPPTRLAAMRVWANGRASLASGDSTKTAEIKHQVISG